MIYEYSEAIAKIFAILLFLAGYLLVQIFCKDDISFWGSDKFSKYEI